MKGRIFDLFIACMMAVFAIDMTSERLHAGLQNQNEYDEIDAYIAKSNKVMAKAGLSVQKAASKQSAMEEEIVANVEELHETVEETTELAEALQVQVVDAMETVNIMEQVAEEVAYTVAYSGLDTISASPVDIKEMIRRKKELMIIDMKIEKALEGDSSANIDELILLKNMYNLNGVK